MSFNNWFNKNIVNNKKINYGDLIECYKLDGSISNEPINSVGILFDDCYFKSVGKNVNSNIIIGNPIKFVDIISIYPKLYKNSKEGILYNTVNAYIIPLCHLDYNHLLLDLMNELCSSFINQKRLNDEYSFVNIFNGMLCGLSSIIYSITNEIFIDKNINHIVFLVNAFNLLLNSIKVSIKHSLDLFNLFHMYPFIANSNNILHSIITMIMLNKNVSNIIRVNWLIKYFEYNKMIDENISDLISIFIITPLLLTKDIDNVYILIKAVNKPILSEISNTIRLPIDFIYDIYDLVINKQNNILEKLNLVDNSLYIKKYSLFQNYIINIDNNIYTSLEPRLISNICINNSSNISIIPFGGDLDFHIKTNDKTIDKLNLSYDFNIEYVNDVINIINNKIIIHSYSNINKDTKALIYFRYCKINIIPY